MAVVDLAVAPRNADGMVTVTGDFYMLKVRRPPLNANFSGVRGSRRRSPRPANPDLAAPGVGR